MAKKTTEKTAIQNTDANEAIQNTDAENQDVEQVSEVTENVVPERPLSARDQLMKELAEKRAKEIRDEDVFNKEEEEEEEEVIVKVKDEINKMVDLKVDGAIIQKSQKEVDAAGGVVELQKQLTGQMRLEQAAKENHRLQNLAKDLQAKDQYLKDLEKKLSTSQTATAQQKAQLQELTDQFVQNVYSGDEDKAKETFSKIVNGLAPQGQKAPENTMREEDVIAKTLYQLSVKSGRKLFEERYGHLKSDPDLFNLTNQKTAELATENPDWEPEKIILEAAKAVDSWLTQYKGDPAKDQSDAFVEQRNQHKRESIQNIATAKARQRKADEIKPKTSEQIFAEIKANRSH